MSINSLEFFIIGAVFVLFYDFFFKYPILLPRNEMDDFLNENKIERTTGKLMKLSFLTPLFFFLVFLLDLSFFAMSFFNLPFAIAFIVIDTIRLWRKEPENRLLNMKDIIMVNSPLLFRLYILVS